MSQQATSSIHQQAQQANTIHQQLPIIQAQRFASAPPPELTSQVIHTQANAKPALTGEVNNPFSGSDGFMMGAGGTLPFVGSKLALGGMFGAFMPFLTAMLASIEAWSQSMRVMALKWLRHVRRLERLAPANLYTAQLDKEEALLASKRVKPLDWWA